ncbi:MAG: G5 domain-containing protein [bacterium]|nr:G5 domain-containing protein [bacterium]
MRRAIFLVLIIGITLGFFLRDLLMDKPAAAKIVTIKSRNLQYQVATRAETVGEVFEEQGLPSSPLVGEARWGVIQGMILTISSPINVSIIDGGESRQIQTSAETVGDLLNLEKIGLAPTDQVSSPLESYLAEGLVVQIDRIVDLEVTEAKEIPFQVTIEHDSEIYYGRESIVRAGELGRKEQLFLITYKNGVEIRRKLLKEQIIETAKPEIRKFGTKIEVQETQEGRASWYATKKCEPALRSFSGAGCAAHPSYAFGRYIMVTSEVTGKSVIVRINDRGPDQAIHPDRVIDLDVTAYRALASPSSGTIPVKVELLR